jgi:hypothetical protein
MDINISSGFFFDKLAVHVAEAYASRNTESPLYTIIAHILVLYGMTSPVHDKRSLGCVPQPLLLDHKSYSRRIPDFSMIVNFDQRRGIRQNNPKYVKPRLAFWVEIKPLNCKPEWDSLEAQELAKLRFNYHLLQMHEQGTFMLQNYPGPSHFGVLIIGMFFTVLRYSRPPSSTTTVSYPSDPHTPPKSSKRKRANTPQETESEYSVINWNPEPLYFCEPILREKSDSFSPAFVRALEYMASHDHDPERFQMKIPFHDSFFNTVESDDSSSDTSSTDDLVIYQCSVVFGLSLIFLNDRIELVNILNLLGRPPWAVSWK